MYKTRGLDGKEYTWNLSMYTNNAREHCSSIHLRARELLKSFFPCDVILEEVPLPGSRLFADFYIHNKRLMVEAQGEQHYEANNFFHKTNMQFYKGVYRDRKKAEWCELNNIILVTLPYNEGDNEWRERIKEAYR